MIRERIVTSLRDLAETLGTKADGTKWYLFGSVDRDEFYAEDIDLMILCNTDDQADSIRQAVDPDALALPLHLALITYAEAAEIDAVSMQRSCAIFP